jgi:hypothetical protein
MSPYCFLQEETCNLADRYGQASSSGEAISTYFGESAAKMPFEQVLSTLLEFRGHFERCVAQNKELKEAEERKAKREEEEARRERAKEAFKAQKLAEAKKRAAAKLAKEGGGAGAGGTVSRRKTLGTDGDVAPMSASSACCTDDKENHGAASDSAGLAPLSGSDAAAAVAGVGDKAWSRTESGRLESKSHLSAECIQASNQAMAAPLSAIKAAGDAVKAAMRDKTNTAGTTQMPSTPMEGKQQQQQQQQVEQKKEGLRFAEGDVMSWDDVSRNVQEAIEMVGSLSLASAQHVLGTPLGQRAGAPSYSSARPLPKAAWR